MSKEFKIGQLVTLIDGFPFDGKIFKIVGDNENPWKRASPFSFDPIHVAKDKDFILLMQQDNGEFSTQSLGDNGLHVSANEIRLHE
jgi:hypothetical protein